VNREMRVGLVVFLAIVFLGALVFVSGGARFRQYGYSFQKSLLEPENRNKKLSAK